MWLERRIARLLCTACLGLGAIVHASGPSMAGMSAGPGQEAVYPGPRILKIDPPKCLPGETVKVHFSVGPAAQAGKPELTKPTELTFDGVPSKFHVEASDMLIATVPLRIRTGVAIPVVIAVGSLRSQPYTDFIVTARSVPTLSEAAKPPQASAFQVVNIDPARACPGDRIRLMTRPSIDPSKPVEVTFNGRPGEVSFDRGELVATVPRDVPTDASATIILTVAGVRSIPFDNFFVLPLPLKVLSVSPNAARPGDTVLINIQPPFQFKTGAEWVVQFDSVETRPLNVYPERFEIQARIPESLGTRVPAIVLISGGQKSNPFTGLRVEQPASPPYLVLGVIALLIAAGGVAYWRLRARRTKRSAIESIPRLSAAEDEREMAYPLPEIPEELAAACRNNECVLYVGAGLSASAGFPTWQPFVRDLLVWAAEKQLIDSSLTDSMRNALQQGQVGTVAENLVSALHGHENLLNGYLRGVFVDPVPKLPAVHSLLKGIAFSGVLTTNFDPLIERTFGANDARVLTPNDSEPLTEALLKRKFFILKLYGTPERPETVMVAPDQYLDAMARNVSFSQFMEDLFLSRSILFLGASLEGIEDYLRGITFRESRGKAHFALVNLSGSGWRPRASSLTRRYGIQVLPFTASSGFPEVEMFLKGLQEKVGAPATKAREFKRLPIKKVHLENIGPFGELDIELDAHMNVLLGDNGVGKSTILKAIAVGILGKTPDDEKGLLAARLIKAGQPEARIILETERGQYFTQLRRTGEGAEIITRGGRPVDEESWLALGFPPLRYVRWGPPEARNGQAEDGPSRSMPGDLLPLLKGEPDPRMEDLKKWLLRVDHLMKDEKNRGDEAGKYGRLFDEFFRLVGLVTKGVLVERGKIDPQTGRIFVHTDDGELPLEAVSQGTQSLIGWIGIILQRLFEWYGDAQDPTRQFALLLMDEIDAHMHPLWQQSLVGVLKDILPAAQFITTSHSPLVVAGLKKDQVTILRRNVAESQKVTAQRAPADLVGWRVDQILTSMSFGLDGARDDESVALISDYTKLAAAEKLNAEDGRKLEAIAAKLRIRLPSPVERENARRAFDLIQSFARQQLEALPDEEKKRMLDEIKVQLQEGITGSRRPM